VHQIAVNVGFHPVMIDHNYQNPELLLYNFYFKNQ